MLTLDAALALKQLPGALASETALVQRWLTERGAEYQGFDFNLRVGRGVAPGANIPEPWRSAALEASRRIIDVVAYRADSIDLLEVKGRADPCAIGQIWAYSTLWDRDNPTTPVRNQGIVCAMLDDELRYVLTLAQISAFVYPDLIPLIRRT